MKKLILLSFLIATNCFASWLVWDPSPPEQQVTQYNIYRGKGASDNPGDLVGVVYPPAHAFDATEFSQQASRTTFAVTAVNANGQSLGSNKVTIQRQ